MRSEKEEKERKKDNDRLKRRKENQVPSALLQGDEPAAKRSKLVLPEPQISEQDLEQVVKLSRASEAAQDAARETGQMVSDSLLFDYSISKSGGLRTPRTPAATTDNILQEAQNLMALTHVETPLVGGSNAPLYNPDFGGATPSKDSAGSNTRAMLSITSMEATPQTGARLPAATPMLRDKLNINPKETPAVLQRTLKEQLKRGLSTLSVPKNDYEIVVAEDEMDTSDEPSAEGHVGASQVEDQADIDARIETERTKQREAQLKRRSQTLQRGLPRPHQVNNSILRPANTRGLSLTDLQKAEELIKHEMLTMMHYDSIRNPIRATVAEKSGSSRKAVESSHNFLANHPYNEYSESDVQHAHALLADEMEKVKVAMGHGDLTMEAYTQVWDECLSQVLFVPSQNKYTRAPVASKKDRLESLTWQLETNRSHMTREAKKAAKLEKKLRTLTDGYQLRAQALTKQTQDLVVEIDKARCKLDGLKFAKKHDNAAIPSPLEVLRNEVDEQKNRERQLQARFQQLQDKCFQATLPRM